MTQFVVFAGPAVPLPTGVVAIPISSAQTYVQDHARIFLSAENRTAAWTLRSEGGEAGHDLCADAGEQLWAGTAFANTDLFRLLSAACQAGNTVFLWYAGATVLPVFKDTTAFLRDVARQAREFEIDACFHPPG